MIAFTRKKEEEFQKKEQKTFTENCRNRKINFQQKFNEEKKLFSKNWKKICVKAIHRDFENRLTILQQSNEEQQEKLKTARQKELEYLRKNRH